MTTTVDNWQAHRTGMRCDTCHVWVRKDCTTLGRCRKHAPTLQGWPPTFEDDWCGDHKLDSLAVPEMAVDPRTATARGPAPLPAFEPDEPEQFVEDKLDQPGPGVGTHVLGYEGR